MDKKLETLLSLLKECKTQTEYANLIQQYCDEQALGFAKWIDAKLYVLQHPKKWGNTGTWTDDPHGPDLTDQELLTRYHESQKP